MFQLPTDVVDALTHAASVNLDHSWTESMEKWREEPFPTWLSNKSMQVEVASNTLPLLNKLGSGYFRQFDRILKITLIHTFAFPG